MTIKMSIMVLILLSFLNLGAVSNNAIIYKNSFNILETNIKDISKFEENGVKLQYKTKENIEKENFRVIQSLTNIINGKCNEINKNQFEIINDDFDINVKMWCEGEYTYSEIIITNNNAKYTTVYLKNILQKLENTDSKNIQYFFYYEGKDKISDSNDSMYKLINDNNIQNVKLLKINNGYTGTGYLSSGDKINFAIVKYNTGSHIIIGTPIIFATY